ncbi:MAG: T9SS type A sorting domain-containing protein [Candidatus Cloacimonetes bacterium]|nr:T9SS type A sorting domain-containing protein [Candidatus Cloacimonadota bacterium]
MAGYNTYSHPQDVVVTTGSNTTIDVALVPLVISGTISGFVTDSVTAAPIAGVTVTAAAFATTTAADGYYNLVVSPDQYDVNCSITMYYPLTQTVTVGNGQDVILDFALVPITDNVWPPVNLSATVQSFTDVQLAWSPPQPPGMIELAYDDGVPESWFWVTDTPTGDEYFAVTFTYDQDFSLEMLKFLIRSSALLTQDIEFGVYPDNGSGAPDLANPHNTWTITYVPVSGAGDWILLDTGAIAFTANELFYVTCRWNIGNDYAVGADESDPDGFSSYRDVSGTWSTVPGHDWIIRSVIDIPVRSTSDGSGLYNPVVITPYEGEVIKSRNLTLDRMAFDSGPLRYDVVPHIISALREVNRDFLGYNIYRNGVAINTALITTTNYLDTNLTDGTYGYEITAMYDGGESVPSNTATVSIVDPGDYYPPENLVAVVEDDIVHLTWDTPYIDEGYLWEQLDSQGETTGKTAQDFETVNDAYDATVAADFILSEQCTITDFIAVGFYNQTHTQPHAFNFAVHADNNGIPDEATLFSTTTSSVMLDDTNGHFVVSLNTPITLGAGTYWASWNIILDYGTDGVQGFMYMRVTLDNGTFGYWRNPGMGFDGSTGLWQATCQNNAGEDRDLAFAILGEPGDGTLCNAVAPIVELDNRRVLYTTISGLKQAPSMSLIAQNPSEPMRPLEREVIAFKVYRDAVMIQEIVDPAAVAWDDTGVAPGDYDYYVTAVYDDVTPAVESIPSNTVTAHVDPITYNPPVNLTGMVVGQDSSNVMLQWDHPIYRPTVTNYKVYRNEEEVGMVAGNIIYYTDIGLAGGEYIYFVTAMYDQIESVASNEITLSIVGNDDNNMIPVVTELNNNYPNPFNPVTTIGYSLKETGMVNVIVFNMRGQKVTTLVNETQKAGRYSVVWDGKSDTGKDISSGVYFYRMKTGRYTSTKKMILMK